MEGNTEKKRTKTKKKLSNFVHILEHQKIHKFLNVGSVKNLFRNIFRFLKAGEKSWIASMFTNIRGKLFQSEIKSTPHLCSI